MLGSPGLHPPPSLKCQYLPSWALLTCVLRILRSADDLFRPSSCSMLCSIAETHTAFFKDVQSPWSPTGSVVIISFWVSLQKIQQEVWGSEIGYYRSCSFRLKGENRTGVRSVCAEMICDPFRVFHVGSWWKWVSSWESSSDSRRGRLVLF